MFKSSLLPYLQNKDGNENKEQDEPSVVYRSWRAIYVSGIGRRPALAR